jgi:hypothetical protein
VAAAVEAGAAEVVVEAGAEAEVAVVEAAGAVVVVVEAAEVAVVEEVAGWSAERGAARSRCSGVRPSVPSCSRSSRYRT